jgi:hypothetical protein
MSTDQALYSSMALIRRYQALFHRFWLTSSKQLAEILQATRLLLLRSSSSSSLGSAEGVLDELLLPRLNLEDLLNASEVSLRRRHRVKTAYLVFNGVGDNELEDLDVTLLPDTIRPVDGLRLDGSLPPAGDEVEGQLEGSPSFGDRSPHGSQRKT